MIPHMAFPDLIAFLQNEAPARLVVRVIAGICALVMVGVILFRRKIVKKDDD